MSTKNLAGIVALTALLTTVPATWGQRGMGDDEGVVRQALETQRVSVEGTIKEIVVEKCENTTGPFEVGMHLLVVTGEEKQYNVHLGPAALVKDLVEPLKTGQSVVVQTFRTEKMPIEGLVAIELKFDSKTVRLRDENLRPVWAGGRDRLFGRYDARSELPRWRQDYGRGYGRGMGRGRGWGYDMGYGPGDSGRGQRRGPGFGYRQGMCPWGGAPGCPRYYGWR